MSKYLVFNIESLENLKFSSTNVQSDSEDTNEYIPGTSIRGAYIYRYMIKKDIKDINQGEHRDKLLNGKIKFLNAYPIYANKRGMPLPKVYFARKDELKSEQNKIDMYPGLGQDLGAGYGKVRACEFVGWEKDSFYWIKVDKISNLHINKMNNKEPNKLFMYEAIKAGQSFQGIIKVEDDEYIEEVREIFENTIVYLGGSKGSGYGKCQIGNISIMEENPELEYFDQSLKGQEIYLLALSDIIYRNEYGEYKTYIEEKDLEKELGLEKVEFIDSSIETKAITNFNNKWNCSTPIINGIKAGSVLKYRITEELNLDSIKKFMDKGIGERRIDGFGRFIILDKIDSATLYKEDEYKGKMMREKVLYKPTEEEREIATHIINDIYKVRLMNDIHRAVIEMDKKLINQDKMTNSQWGNLKGLFTSLSYENPKSGNDKYAKYMENISSKRSTSFSQISSVRYGEENLLEFLDRFMEESTNLSLFNEGSIVERISHMGIESTIDKEYLYKYNMTILTELFRYQIRKGEE